MMEVNFQGMAVINGRVMPVNPDRLPKPGEVEEQPIDQAVREILRETSRLRNLGLLAPFVEGEAIGKAPWPRAHGPWRGINHTRERNRRMEYLREDMLLTRKKNNAEIRRLLA